VSCLYYPVGVAIGQPPVRKTRAMCLGVSCPAPHCHLAMSKPGTFWLYKNLAKPIRPVQAWTNSALSALQRLLWGPKTYLVGGGSSGMVWRFPRFTLGRTERPSLLFSACHRFSQSRMTSFFSRQPQCLRAIPVHSSTQSFLLVPDVAVGCALAGPRRFVQCKILALIVLQASLIFVLFRSAQA
jgi:hypothetical protein